MYFAAYTLRANVKPRTSQSSHLPSLSLSSAAWRCSSTSSSCGRYPTTATAIAPRRTTTDMMHRRRQVPHCGRSPARAPGRRWRERAGADCALACSLQHAAQMNAETTYRKGASAAAAVVAVPTHDEVKWRPVLTTFESRHAYVLCRNKQIHRPVRLTCTSNAIRRTRRMKNSGFARRLKEVLAGSWVARTRL